MTFIFINNMYIRIEFKDLESDKTQDTRATFFGIPNGMFLSSFNARAISPKEVRDAVGYSVVFWYLDVEVLNKKYGGVLNCLNSLLTYSGVARVDVLPIEGKYDSCIEKLEELDHILMKYAYGV